MTLKSMTLHSFGRYKEVTVDLDAGFNVLYGANGTGKSTLIQFLLWMFYDPQHGKRTLREKLRERFRPWDGSALWGELEFLHEGVLYRMERFYDTAAKKRFSVHHGVTGEDVTADFMPTPGEVLFGFGQEAFLRTFFVGQLSTPFEKEGKEDELQAALMNLSTSGNEAVSAQKAEKTLSDAAKTFRLKSGRGGLIGASEERLDRLYATAEERRRREAELHLKIKRLEQVEAQIEEQKHAKAAALYAAQQKQKEQLSALETEAEAIVKELERTDLLLEGVVTERLSEAEEACRERKRIAERKARLAAETEALKVQQARVAEQARLASEQAARKGTITKLVCTLCGVLLMAVALFGLLAQKIWWPALLPVGGLGILLLAVAFLPKKQETAVPVDDIAPRLTILTAEAKDLEEQDAAAERVLIAVFGRAVLEEDVRLAVTRFNDRKIKQLQWDELEKRRGLLTARTTERTAEPTEDNGVVFDEALFRRLLTEMGSLTAELESGFAGLPDIRSLTEEIAAEEERLTHLRQKHEALVLAGRWISEQAEVLRNSFGPQLNEAAAKVLTALTDGAVSGVRVSGEYKMELTDGQGSHALDYFSNGTVDQAYLALRLGILDLLEKNGDGPLLLDDVFCQYDDNRLRAGLAFLAARAAHQQILYCTCRREEYPVGTKIVNLDGLF